MKKFTMAQLTNEEGVRIFYTNSSRINITDLPKDKFEDTKKQLKNTFKTPGVYILFGQKVEDGRDIAYIGESDNLSNRINDHVKSKPWIDRFVLITSQFSLHEFSKTELHFIEKQLINDFNMYSDYDVTNGNEGQGRHPEPLLEIELKGDVSLIEEGLGILGYKIDNTTTIKGNSLVVSDIDKRTDIEVFAKIPKNGRTIKGIMKFDDSITILKGEKLKASVSNKNPIDKAATIKMLKRLEAAKQIINHGSDTEYDIEFIEDVRFNKPSPAGVLICGGVNNGWFLWVDKIKNEKIDYLRNLK